MRRVVVEQRAALQVVFHQEKPDRGVQQSVQSTPNPSAEPTETRTCWCRELSSSDWRANRSRTASTRESSTHGYLAILDVQSLELGKTARMLEHVLVLEHHAQIHLLQNILHSLLLYLSFSTKKSTQFAVGVFVLSVERADHAGFADRATHRANLPAPFQKRAATEVLEMSKRN